MSYRHLKSTLEYLVTLASLPLWGSLLICLALLLKFKEGGPIFFVQERVGKGNRTFGCIKLRTMRTDAEQMLQQWKDSNSPEWQEYVTNNFKLKDDPRVSPLGSVLRRTSLDELPQLINVLNGSMSLIGPRPLLEREVIDYGQERFKVYCEFKPGVSGLWQVSGRNEVSFEQRAEFDRIYAENFGLKQDLMILVKTLQVVLDRTGAY